LNSAFQTDAKQDLRRSKSAESGEAMFRHRAGVRINAVPVTQDVFGGLVEAMWSRRCIADRRWQRVSLAHAVLVHRTERSTSLSFRFLVVRFVPQWLQPGLAVTTEPASTSTQAVVESIPTISSRHFVRK